VLNDNETIRYGHINLLLTNYQVHRPEGSCELPRLVFPRTEYPLLPAGLQPDIVSITSNPCLMVEIMPGPVARRCFFIRAFCSGVFHDDEPEKEQTLWKYFPVYFFL